MWTQLTAGNEANKEQFQNMQTMLINTEKDLKISNLEKNVLEIKNELKNQKDWYEIEIQTITKNSEHIVAVQKEENERLNNLISQSNKSAWEIEKLMVSSLQQFFTEQYWK